MIPLSFPGCSHFSYDLCGKFQSPSNEWMHLTRELTNFELMAVTDGTLCIADSKGEYEVKTGEYLLMAPDIHQHGFRRGGCSFYWLHFTLNSPDISASPYAPPSQTVNGISDSASASGPSPIEIPVHAPLASPDRVVILLKQLQDTSLRYHNAFLNDSLTAAILGEISCQSSLCRQHLSLEQRTQVYQDIISYIQSHSSEDLKVSALADYFGYSDKYLSSFFSARSGMPLKQFILRTKMDSAMAELTDTNHTVSQIAYNVGFKDVHNFAHAFRKITGMSPSQYRRSYGQRRITFE